MLLGRFHFIKGLFRNILLRVVSSLDLLTHLRGTIIIREGIGKREIATFILFPVEKGSKLEHAFS